MALRFVSSTLKPWVTQAGGFGGTNACFVRVRVTEVMVGCQSLRSPIIDRQHYKPCRELPEQGKGRSWLTRVLRSDKMWAHLAFGAKADRGINELEKEVSISWV